MEHAGHDWTQSTSTYVAMAADDLSGSTHLGVVYFDHGSSQSITIDLSKFAGTITAKWIDPTNGAASIVAGSPFSNSGTHAFSPSGKNAGGDPDRALLTAIAVLLGQRLTWTQSALRQFGRSVGVGGRKLIGTPNRGPNYALGGLAISRRFVGAPVQGKSRGFSFRSLAPPRGVSFDGCH